ncbi:MAG: SufD family Fe-S cluster assembly protein [Spirochaetes bacterium]|jgi:hypothetical protein|nr:SufD family Fe-S cluster assembly protein [Spirochaetota bacterium]
MKQNDDALEIYKSIELDPHSLKDPGVAHVTVNENRVLSSNTVPGLDVAVKELGDGVDIKMSLADGTIVKNPVHLCFGVIPAEGVQRIVMDVDIGKNSRIVLFAHCSFPFAVNVRHIMDARINIGDGAEYSYFERHVHSDSGGVTVIPKAVITVGSGARFSTRFELLKGRVGEMDISYETFVREKGVVEMTALVNARGTDRVKISETSSLDGAHSRAVLTSKVAVRDDASAEVHNRIIAGAPYARGHVDCKEIVMDRGTATAVPIVDVRNAKAHVTHEAAVGSVDKKQLETLMSRGLSEEGASELIIQGLLS